MCCSGTRHAQVLALSQSHTQSPGPTPHAPAEISLSDLEIILQMLGGPLPASTDVHSDGAGRSLPDAGRRPASDSTPRT